MDLKMKIKAEFSYRSFGHKIRMSELGRDNLGELFLEKWDYATLEDRIAYGALARTILFDFYVNEGIWKRAVTDQCTSFIYKSPSGIEKTSTLFVIGHMVSKALVFSLQARDLINCHNKLWLTLDIFVACLFTSWRILELSFVYETRASMHASRNVKFCCTDLCGLNPRTLSIYYKAKSTIFCIQNRILWQDLRNMAPCLFIRGITKL